jgi:hypothetical protein
MANHVVVDKTLQGTRIITARGAAYGDNLHVVEVVPIEFGSLCAFYPILMSGNPDRGGYVFVSVLGFEPGENLFLDDSGWDAGYVPLTVRRQPFLLLPQKINEEDGTTSTVPILAIDMDSPRVSQEQGEAMFDEGGEATDWFKDVNRMIAGLVQGSEMGRELIRKLDVLELIEPLELSVRLVDGNTRRLEGLHTISDGKLQNLSDRHIVELHQLGYLDYIYSMRASLGHFGGLARRKNARLSP